MDSLEKINSNYIHSTLRERVVEHIFVGEVLRWLWVRNKTDVEVLRSEFDAGGYDLVMSYGKTVRHIQFKTTATNGKAANIKANIKLMEKPSGCIIWVFVTPKLELAHYRWLGGPPGQQLPDIRSMKVAKHTKGDAKGKKNERPQHRIIPKGQFRPPCSLDKLLEYLFGVIE